MKRLRAVILKVFAAISALLFFCSCNAVSLSGTESLLVAPKLNKRQAEISQALETTLSLRSIVYRYPQSGEYRSPFIFYDLDGDSKDEAIVFYSFANDTGNVRAKIFYQKDDLTWSPLSDIPSQNGQVEFVRFEKLLDANSSCVLIGWKNTGRRVSNFAVYSMRNGAFKFEANSDYINYEVLTLDGEPLGQIVTINKDQSGFYVSLLNGLSGHLETVGRQILAADVDSILALKTGKLWEKNYGIYIDEALTDGSTPTTATEIIQVTPSGLTLLAGGEAILGEEENTTRDNYEVTFRDEEILCMDIEGDGVVEVPYPVSLPGSAEDDGIDMDIPKLIQFMRLTPEGFNIERSAVINFDAGYLLYFPDRWKDNVTVEQARESGEWHFRKWNPNTLDSAEELLRIRVSPTMEYLDMFEEYIPLTTKGTLFYTAYIPKIQDEPLAVDKNEVETMFKLLNSL